MNGSPSIQPPDPNRPAAASSTPAQREGSLGGREVTPQGQGEVHIDLFKRYVDREIEALAGEVQRRFSASIGPPAAQVLEAHERGEDVSRPLSQLLKEAENIILEVKGTTYSLPTLIQKLGFSEEQMVRCIELFTLDPVMVQRFFQTQFEAYEIQRDGLMRALGTTNIPIADEVMDAMRRVESGLVSVVVNDPDNNVRYRIQLEGGDIGPPEIRAKIIMAKPITGGEKEFSVAVTRNSLEKQAHLRLFKNYKEEMLQNLKASFPRLSLETAQEIITAMDRITREVDEKRITQHIYNFSDSHTKDSWQLILAKSEQDELVVVLDKIDDKGNRVLRKRLPFLENREIQLHLYFQEQGVKNLPKIIDFNENFVATELVGKDVLEAFRGRMPTADDIKKVCSTVAETLEGMHGLGFAHFDINPENTLVEMNEKGELVAAKVIDVGLALKVEPNQRYQKGKTLYFAPEMYFPDKSVGVEADIYALGAMAFELKTGGKFYLRNFPAHLDKQEIRVLSKHIHEQISGFTESQRIRFFLNRLGIIPPPGTITLLLDKSSTNAVLPFLLKHFGGMDRQDAIQYLIIYKMLDPDPKKRPTAKKVKAYFS